MIQHIAHMVREGAARWGERTVFKYKDKSDNTYKPISWNSFIERSDKIASALLNIGSKPNDNIGIFSHNKVEWTLTDVGIFTIGAVSIPLYGTASKQQVKYIVDETEMRVLFVGNKEQLDTAIWAMENCSTLEKIIVFEDIAIENDSCVLYSEFVNSCEVKSKEIKEILDVVQPDDLASIVYTSGTTGEPKGVMLTHSNFMYAYIIHNDRLKLTLDDVSMSFLPLSHIFERAWSYYVISRGAVNVFLEDTKSVVKELSVVKPSMMCAVPRFFEKTHEGIMAEYHKWPNFKKNIFDWSINVGYETNKYKANNEDMPFALRMKSKIAYKLVYKNLQKIFGGNIRFMPCSGAAISSELLKFFHAAGIFVNFGYGATETTATVACFRSDVYNLDYCGEIMPGVSVRIGDKNEMLVKGHTVFKGYYKKPEATAEALKNGWYHTGDEGHMIDGTYFNMTDRIKDLMKSSLGKYISPQKIEMLLSLSKYVEQVTTIANKRKYVSALIVPSYSVIQTYADSKGIKGDMATLLKTQEILDEIKRDIDAHQEELPPYEKVAKFALLDEPFTIENNVLTNSLKIKRKVIVEKYSNVIEEMYK